MKGKMMSIAELEVAINKALSDLAGTKYGNGKADLSKQVQGRIAETLSNLGIQELSVEHSTRIDARFNIDGLELMNDHVADVHYDLKKDARIKYGTGRGKVNSITVKFRTSLFGLTLHEARNTMIRESVDECISRLNNVKNEALQTVKEMDEQLEMLSKIKV